MSDLSIIELHKSVKPCPFCGSDNIYVTFEPGYLDDSAIVFCNACKVSVKLEENDQEGFSEETAKKAVEAWNKRAERKEELDCINGAEEVLRSLPSVQPDKDVIDDCLRHIYKNISVHTATGGVIAIRYYMEKLYEEIYGEGERPWWMT